MGNLPIYSDFRNGRTRQVTIVRKFTGDVDALAGELERVCEQPVTRYHGRLEVKGLHVDRLTHWMTGLGF